MFGKLKALFATAARQFTDTCAPASPPPRRCSLQIEELEDRLVPANWTVNPGDISNVGSGFTGGLRFCLNGANGAGGLNTISLATGSTYTFSDTTGANLFNYGLYNVSRITGGSTLTINGNGATVQRAGTAFQFRFFITNPNGTAIVNDLTLTGFSTSDVGGVVRVYNNGSVTFNRCDLINNASGSLGGAVECDTGSANFTLNSCLVTTNSAPSGGGLGTSSSNNSITVNNSSIVNNTATGGGGGIYIQSAAGFGLTVANSTIANNNATGNGGGIDNAVAADFMTVTNSTIAGNTSGGTGGGFFNAGTTPANSSFTNTIIATNNANTAVDVGGNNFIATYCLIGSTTGAGFTGLNNVLNVNPNLGPLQNNGSATVPALPTMALLAGSPAIDKGTNTGTPATDERGTGFNRIINGTIDIGAYEFQPPATVTVGSSLNPSQVGQSVTFTATLALAAGSNTPSGTVTFLDNGASIGTGTLSGTTATFTTSGLAVGSQMITAMFNSAVPSSPNSTSSPLTQVVNPLPVPPPPPPPAPTGLYAVGADAGGVAVVNVYSATTGVLKFSIAPFGFTFRGGVRVAVGDTNGDGTPDIICGAGPGGSPVVQFFSGINADLIGIFYALTPTFTGGVNVAAGDVNGDGFTDVIVGADAGGGPQVGVFSGKGLGLIASFYAFGAPNFTGGVRVAAGDITGDGKSDIVCAAGPGGGPLVAVYNGAALAPIESYFAFGAVFFTGGVYVGAGNLSGTGPADIILGAGAGGGPQVQVRDSTGNTIQNFYATGPGFTGGVRVGAVDVSGRGVGPEQILTGAGPHGGPQVQLFDGATLATLSSFYAFNASFGGGLFVG